MKRKIMKGLAVISTLAMIFSVAGCGKVNDTKESSTVGNNKEASTKQEETKSDEKITLNLWHIWPSDAGDRVSIDAYVKEFEAKYPNVTINQDASDTESYKTKLKVAFSGGELPDVYFTYGAGFSQPFVQTGGVMALDDVISAETKSKLLDGIESNYIYDGKLYGLPIKMWAGVMYCNQELFDQAGLELPKNWDELLTCVDAFRAKDITPMCVGGKDGWHPAMYFDMLAVREAGVDGVISAMNSEKSFNDPEFLEAATKFKTLVDRKAFPSGFEGLGAQEAQAEFLMGRIPMYFNGSWLTGDIQNDLNQVKDKIVVIPFPNTSNGTAEYTGGAIDGYSVSAKTKYPELAVEFMVGLAEYQSNASYLSGDGISVWKSNVDESQINPVLTQITSLLKDAKGYSLAWDTQLSGADIDTYLRTLQELQGGARTPQEFVDVLQNNLSVAK